MINELSIEDYSGLTAKLKDCLNGGDEACDGGGDDQITFSSGLDATN